MTEAAIRRQRLLPRGRQWVPPRRAVGLGGPEIEVPEDLLDHLGLLDEGSDPHHTWLPNVLLRLAGWNSGDTILIAVALPPSGLGCLAGVTGPAAPPPARRIPPGPGGVRSARAGGRPSRRPP